MAMVILLIVGLIKKTLYKRVNTFLNQINILEETLMLKLIYPMMQKNYI